MSVACGIQCHFGKGKASCMGESHVPLSLGLFETRLFDASSGSLAMLN